MSDAPALWDNSEHDDNDDADDEIKNKKQQEQEQKKKKRDERLQEEEKIKEKEKRMRAAANGSSKKDDDGPTLFDASEHDDNDDEIKNKKNQQEQEQKKKKRDKRLQEKEKIKEKEKRMRAQAANGSTTSKKDDDGPTLFDASVSAPKTTKKNNSGLSDADIAAKNRAKMGYSSAGRSGRGPQLFTPQADSSETTSKSSNSGGLNEKDRAAKRKAAMGGSSSKTNNQQVVVTADASGMVAPALVSVNNPTMNDDAMIKNQVSSNRDLDYHPTDRAQSIIVTPGAVNVGTSTTKYDDDDDEYHNDNENDEGGRRPSKYDATKNYGVGVPATTTKNSVKDPVDDDFDENNSVSESPNYGIDDDEEDFNDKVARRKSAYDDIDNDGMIGYDPATDNDEGLAVAVAINEEDEDDPYENVHLLPDAIEYDPDSKPPLYKNRKFRFYAMAGGLVLVVIVIVIIVAAVMAGGSSSDNDETSVVQGTYAPTGTPTSAPTTSDIGRLQNIAKSLLLPWLDSSAKADNIIDDFDAYMNSNNVTDTQREAYESAIDWILNEDPMKLTLLSKNFEQRFLLAYFYYHVIIEGKNLLGEGQGWLSCGKADTSLNETDECDLAVFNRNYETDAVYYTIETRNIRWLSGETECSWAGLFCDENDQVAAIDLFGQNFTGPLPKELAYIPSLQYFGLSYNLFTGTIPTEFASLKRLINFELNGNFFSGEFSSEYLNALALQRLNVGENQLTGSLINELDPSASVGNLQSLKGLFVDDNDLSGPFPSELGMLEFLGYTRLQKNDFDPGSIPTELGQLTLLQELWLGWCSFTGMVPTELGMLTEMTDLRFENNKLTGPLPDELYELTDLIRFFIESNYFTGTLSPMIGQLEELDQIRLRYNEFTGAIPSEIGLIKKLNLAWLGLNNFKGPIPDEMCANSAIPGIGTGNGNLEFLNADCTGGDNAATPCQKYCCTACCSKETMLCFVDRDD